MKIKTGMYIGAALTALGMILIVWERLADGLPFEELEDVGRIVFAVGFLTWFLFYTRFTAKLKSKDEISKMNEQ